MSVPARMKWTELENLISRGLTDELGRLPEDLEIYKARLLQITEEYLSVEHYILHTVFHYETVETEIVKETDGAKKRVKSVVTLKDNEKKLRFVLNDFPYAVEAGIQHHLLWSTAPLQREEIETEVEKHRPKNKWDVLIFINSAQRRSVSLFHAHILSKPRW